MCCVSGWFENLYGKDERNTLLVQKTIAQLTDAMTVLSLMKVVRETGTLVDCVFIDLNSVLSKWTNGIQAVGVASFEHRQQFYNFPIGGIHEIWCVLFILHFPRSG